MAAWEEQSLVSKRRAGMSRFIGGRLTEKVYLLEIREERRVEGLAG